MEKRSKEKSLQWKQLWSFKHQIKNIDCFVWVFSTHYSIQFNQNCWVPIMCHSACWRGRNIKIYSVHSLTISLFNIETRPFTYIIIIINITIFIIIITTVLIYVIGCCVTRNEQIQGFGFLFVFLILALCGAQNSVENFWSRCYFRVIFMYYTSGKMKAGKTSGHFKNC